MKPEYVRPFLESASLVIEQVAGVKPLAGQASLREMVRHERYLWIHIGLNGQMTGDVIFGLHEEVALKMVSAMMGGFVMTELDEMGQSAISELGNMISGNATSLLYHQGIEVDITPPQVLTSIDTGFVPAAQAMSVPLSMDGIGQLDIQVLIA